MKIENQNSKYRSNSHFLFCCRYHIIFCPKYRRSVLTEDISNRLKEIILETFEKYNSKIKEKWEDFKNI